MKHTYRDSKGRFAKVPSTTVSTSASTSAPQTTVSKQTVTRVAKKGSLCEDCPAYKNCELSLRQDQ